MVHLSWLPYSTYLYLGPKVLSKLSQSCIKFAPKLSQSRLQVAPKLAQSCPKVVSQSCPKASLSCPKVVSNLSLTGVGWGVRIWNRAQRVDHLKVRMAIRAPGGAKKNWRVKLKKCSPCLSLFSPAQPSVFLVGVGWGSLLAVRPHCDWFLKFFLQLWALLLPDFTLNLSL